MLKEKLRELIKERFADFTPAQKEAIPEIESGKNILLIAPTGLGKTESALLPIFDRLLEAPDKTGVQALYITPLRALNRDMLERIGWWCTKLGITHAVRHGDTPQYQRMKMGKKPPQILITTPESFQAMLAGGRLSLALSNVRHVVVDEVHSLFPNKRGMQLALGLERLKQRASFQIIGLSATISSQGEAAKFLFGAQSHKIIEVKYPRPVGIEVLLPKKEKNDENEADRLYVDSGAAARLRKIEDYIKQKRTLVFVNTRQVAENLSSRLIASGAKIAVHHGSLARESRLKAEDDFRAGKLDALVCTSSLELGIDIGDVAQVVQYMSPRQSSRLLQRIGRSGHRIGLVPDGIVMPTDGDDCLEACAIALAAKENFVEAESAESGGLDVIAHQLAGMALENGTTTLRFAHGIFSRSKVYGISEQKLGEIALQLASSRLLSYDSATGLIAKNAGTRNYYFSHLSTIPSIKKFSIVNTENNKHVSTLDEGFVATLDVGSGFISRGVPWLVTGIFEGEIFVQQSSDLSLSPPDWTGDEIPVAKEIAWRVGSLRHAIYAKTFHEKAKALGNVAQPYAVAGLFSSPENIVLEACGDTVIINMCQGTKINTAFGKALASMVGASTGRQPYVVTDPYRVILKLSRPLHAKKIEAIIRAMSDIGAIIRADMSSWGLLRFKLNHVARGFGLLDPDATIGKHLMNLLQNTPVYEEAVRTVTRQYLDVVGAQKLLLDIADGKAILHCSDVSEFSEISRLGIVQVAALELLEPVQPYSSIVESFKKSLLDKHLKFECTYCGKISYHRARELPQKVRCLHCSSPLVALVGEAAKPASKREKMGKDELGLSASLIEAYGRRGALAQAAFGVGPATAARVLKNLRREDELFYADLLEAQKQFIRTKKYWSPR